MSDWAHKRAARRKLLNILPRASLEALSHHERPHTLTKTELVDLASTKGWELDPLP